MIPKFSSLSIYYGSKLGHAQRFAYALAAALANKRLRAPVAQLNSLVPQSVASDQLCILLVASTGSGDPTPNAQLFFDRIKTTSTLKKFNYFLFGLGDSSFQNFNGASKQLEQMLLQKGARQVGPSVYGDDVDGHIHNDFQQWRQEIVAILQKSPDIPRNDGPVQSFFLNKKCKADPIQPPGFEQFKHLDQLSMTAKGFLKAAEGQLVETEQLRGSITDGSTRRLQIKLPSGVKYQPASTCLVYPSNQPSAVQKALTFFGLQEDQVIAPFNREQNLPFPFPISAKDLFSSFLDLAAPVSKQTRRKFGLPQWKDYAGRQPSLIECLVSQGGKISLQDFVKQNEGIKPRHYTVSGAKLDSVQLTVKVQPHGLFGRTVAQSLPGQKVRLDFEPSVFLDWKKHRKMVMVGAGSGIAPFRSIVLSSDCTRQLHLVFGCRHPEVDYLYKVEVEEWLRTGRLASVSVAFSRHGAKEYVQNLLRRDQAWVRTVEEGGAVLLCGSGGMCRAVEAVVRETLEQLRPGLFEQLKKEARLLVQSFG